MMTTEQRAGLDLPDCTLDHDCISAPCETCPVLSDVAASDESAPIGPESTVRRD